MNKQVVKDAHPLANINGIFDLMAEFVVWATLDIASGFHNLIIDEESRPLTTFSDGEGLYQYRRIPMGYTNAPAEFARAMRIVLDDARSNQKCLQTEIFMDDAICGGKNLADLLRETNELLAYMKKYGLPTNPDTTMDNQQPEERDEQQGHSPS